MSESLGFVHFDSSSSKNNRVDVLVTKDKCKHLLRNKFIAVSDGLTGKRFIGRVIEGPYYQPEEVGRDSALAQVAILHGEEFPAPPNYYGTFRVEIIGELDQDRLIYTGSRPAPQAKVTSLTDKELHTILGISDGNIFLGHLEGYPSIPIKFDSTKISIIPRNMGIFGTVGSGKTNTAQVLIEELSSAGWAVLVLDIEGEYTDMNNPNSKKYEIDKLKDVNVKCEGIKDFAVAKLCGQESTSSKAQEITINIDQIDPYVLAEILNTTEPQTAALFTLIDICKSNNSHGAKERPDHKDDPLTPGKKKKRAYTLIEIINAIDAERKNPGRTLVKESSLQPLKRKLETLHRTHVFDDLTAASIDPDKLLRAGRVTVFDLSYTGDYEKNLLTAQLLTRIFDAKTSSKNSQYPPTIIMIEEAHSFISRENRDKMFETMRKLKEIARRGRKRWLALAFISQQPSHLPNEIFELANTRIVHSIRSTKNLEVLKNSSGDISEEMWESAANLDVGEAIVNSPQYRNSVVAKVRFAKTNRRRLED